MMACGCREEDVMASLMGLRCSICENAPGVDHCHGLWLDHLDGSGECEDGCGRDVLHARGASCGVFAPCDRCR